MKRPVRRRGWGKVLLLVAVGLWVFLLYGFISTRSLILLALVGPLILLAGLYLTKHVLASRWSAGGLVVGLLMLAGAVVTLAPAAPDRLLVLTTTGWEILDQRVLRLTEAIDAGDINVARRLAGRGLGDAAPLDASGRPVIHRAENAEMLTALLESGLDPDARDADDRTLLMVTRRPELARILLETGADIDVKDRSGFTLADVHAVDEPLRRLLESYAGRPLLQRADVDAVVRGRTDWWTVEKGAAATLERSAVTLDHRPVRRGDVATVRADIINRSADDRVLEVTATLNTAALFVAASHGGSIENPEQPQLVQTIRWPPLALAAHHQGRLELQIVTRSDHDSGDLAVDWQIRQLPNRQEETLRLHEPLDDAEGQTASQAVIWFYVALAAIFMAGPLLLIRWWRARQRAAAVDSGVHGVAWVPASVVTALTGGLTMVLLWSMGEPLFRFQEATCTILDRRFQVATSRSTTSLGRAGRRSGSRGTPYAVPLIAVRIDSGAAPVYATGFAVDVTGRSVEELRQFSLGASVPCWVDPNIASRFTLVRRPSLSSVAAIGTLSVLTLVLTALTRWLRSRTTVA